MNMVYVPVVFQKSKVYGVLQIANANQESGHFNE
jgi:hypothetical protein